MKKMVLLIFIFLFISQLNIFAKKLYFYDNWTYSTESSFIKSNWQNFNLGKTLKDQGIKLKKSNTIYLKNSFTKNDIKDLMNNKNKTIGLFIGKIDGDAEIYVNNLKIAESKYINNNIIAKIPAEIIQTNNLLTIKILKKHRVSTCRFSLIPYIEEYRIITNYDSIINFTILFIGLCVFFIGLFFIFFFNKKLKNYEFILYLILCSCVCVYAILKSSFKTNIINIFPYSWFSFSWLLFKKIEFTSLYLLPVVGLLFIVKIFNLSDKIFNNFIKNIIKSFKTNILTSIMIIVGAINILITIIILLPFTSFDFMRAVTLNIYYFVFGISFAYYYYMIFKELCKKNLGSIFILLGVSSILISAVLEIFSLFNPVVWNRYPLTVPGFFIFLFFFGIYLSRQFVQVNLDLKALNVNLEIKVKERTEELELKEKQRTNYFINLAHETKTPLTLISNYLDKDINNRGTSDELKIVKINIIKLERDMKNFLDSEKLDRGQIFYNHNQVINFSEMLKVKILLFKEVANKKNIKITNSIIKDNLHTEIDPDAMDKIINNLLDNAIKYTNNGGKIEVSLRQDHKVIELEVKDTGIGISEEQIEHIFKPYHQISHRKTSTQGIGMGLNIVKKIIEGVNGSIEVHSELNKGTTFIVRLLEKKIDSKTNIENVNYEKPVDITVDIQLLEEEYDKDKKTLFIVEDNIQMLAYLQAIFVEEYNVYYALNGKKALEKLSEINYYPDLFISDIMMDEMDGYEFYENLLENENFRSIPFIFLTAKSNERERINGLSKGAVDFISKPFNVNELKEKIKSMVQLISEHHKQATKSFETKILNFIRNPSEEEKDSPSFKENCKKFNITLKEEEIIRLLIKGLQYKEISGQLDVSENTVKKQISNIYKKCSVTNKVELFNLFNK